MELDVSPEPAAPERAAIELALRAVLAQPEPSAWRVSALDPDPVDDDVPRPRREATQQE